MTIRSRDRRTVGPRARRPAVVEPVDSPQSTSDGPGDLPGRRGAQHGARDRRVGRLGGPRRAAVARCLAATISSGLSRKRSRLQVRWDHDDRIPLRR
jgi:hypothetical protein